MYSGGGNHRQHLVFWVAVVLVSSRWSTPHSISLVCNVFPWDRWQKVRDKIKDTFKPDSMQICYMTGGICMILTMSHVFLQALRQLNNFAGMFAISAAFESSSVYRLKNTVKVRKDILWITSQYHMRQYTVHEQNLSFRLQFSIMKNEPLIRNFCFNQKQHVISTGTAEA